MKKNELLRPCYLQEAAQNRMKELLEAKKILTEEQNRNSVKCYGKSLRVVENNHSYAYYIRTTGYDSKGIYLSAGNKDLADCLATVEYTKKCLTEIEKEIASLGKFLKTYTDEATTGLHTDDVAKLIKILDRIVDNGDSVMVIEHNMDVIRHADYIIDLGPEGGDKGGQIVATGTPEEVAKVKESYTGQYLRKGFKNGK